MEFTEEQAKVIGEEATKVVNGEKSMPFWAHSVCFSCGHNLKEDKDHQPWQGMTYCPKCNRSFLE